MSSLMDVLMQQFSSGDTLSSLSQQIGADEGQTSQALSMAVPLLLSALARNASDPTGAKSLHKALKRDHDGSILDDMSGLLGNAQAANGAGILRHVLGEQRSTVETRLAEQTGLGADGIGQLLELVAPVVMGALGRTQRQKKLGPKTLATLLRGERKAVQESAPDVMGLLGTLLDANQDGNIVDDLANLAGTLLGGRR